MVDFNDIFRFDELRIDEINPSIPRVVKSNEITVSDLDDIILLYFPNGNIYLNGVLWGNTVTVFNNQTIQLEVDHNLLDSEIDYEVIILERTEGFTFEESESVTWKVSINDIRNFPALKTISSSDDENVREEEIGTVNDAESSIDSSATPPIIISVEPNDSSFAVVVSSDSPPPETASPSSTEQLSSSIAGLISSGVDDIIGSTTSIISTTGGLTVDEQRTLVELLEKYDITFPDSQSDAESVRLFVSQFKEKIDSLAKETIESLLQDEELTKNIIQEKENQLQKIVDISTEKVKETLLGRFIDEESLATVESQRDIGSDDDSPEIETRTSDIIKDTIENTVRETRENIESLNTIASVIGEDSILDPIDVTDNVYQESSEINQLSSQSIVQINELISDNPRETIANLLEKEENLQKISSEIQDRQQENENIINELAEIVDENIKAFVEDGVFVGTIEQSKVSIKDSLEDVNLVSSELKEILDLDEQVIDFVLNDQVLSNVVSSTTESDLSDLKETKTSDSDDTLELKEPLLSDEVDSIETSDTDINILQDDPELSDTSVSNVEESEDLLSVDQSDDLFTIEQKVIENVSEIVKTDIQELFSSENTEIESLLESVAAQVIEDTLVKTLLSTEEELLESSLERILGESGESFDFNQLERDEITSVDDIFAKVIVERLETDDSLEYNVTETTLLDFVTNNNIESFIEDYLENLQTISEDIIKDQVLAKAFFQDVRESLLNIDANINVDSVVDDIITYNLQEEQPLIADFINFVSNEDVVITDRLAREFETSIVVDVPTDAGSDETSDSITASDQVLDDTTSSTTSESLVDDVSQETNQGSDVVDDSSISSNLGTDTVGDDVSFTESGSDTIDDSVQTVETGTDNILEANQESSVADSIIEDSTSIGVDVEETLGEVSEEILVAEQEPPILSDSPDISETQPDELTDSSGVSLEPPSDLSISNDEDSSSADNLGLDSSATEVEINELAESPDIVESEASDININQEISEETPVDSGDSADVGEETPTDTGDSADVGEETPTDTGDSADVGEETPTDAGDSADVGEETPSDAGDSADVGEETPIDSGDSADVGETPTTAIPPSSGEAPTPLEVVDPGIGQDEVNSDFVSKGVIRLRNGVITYYKLAPVRLLAQSGIAGPFVDRLGRNRNIKL